MNQRKIETTKERKRAKAMANLVRFQGPNAGTMHVVKSVDVSGK